jgi:nitrate/nitrite transporter NarK
MNEREGMVESLRHLGQDLGDLFRAELAQFKREVTSEGRKLAIAGIWLAGAAVMGFAFLGVFTAFAVIVLTLVFQPWLAALIITVAWGFIAFAMLAAAKMKLDSALPIELETTRSVKEDIEWIKSGMKSAK